MLAKTILIILIEIIVTLLETVCINNIFDRFDNFIK